MALLLFAIWNPSLYPSDMIYVFILIITLDGLKYLSYISDVPLVYNLYILKLQIVS